MNATTLLTQTQATLESAGDNDLAAAFAAAMTAARVASHTAMVDATTATAWDFCAQALEEVAAALRPLSGADITIHIADDVLTATTQPEIASALRDLVDDLIRRCVAASTNGDSQERRDASAIACQHLREARDELP